MKKSMKVLLSTAICLACIQGGVQAADTVLDEVIVNADKEKAYAGGYLSTNTSLGMQKNKDAMELPASTMTITDKAIKDFAISGNNEIMDILSLNAGVRRTTSDNTISLRGAYTTAAKMSVNNIPGMLNDFGMGTNFIGNIDILSGPSLVYSGSSTENSIGGTVNFRSKAAEKEPITNASIKYTGTSNLQESIDISRRFGDGQAWGIRINALTGDGSLAVHGEKLKNRNIFVNLDHQSVDSSTNLLLGYAKTIHHGGNSIFQFIHNDDPNLLKTMPFLPSAPNGKYNMDASWAYTERKTWVMTLNHDQKINDHWTTFVNAGIKKTDTPISIGTWNNVSIKGHGSFIFNTDGSFDGSFERGFNISASGGTSRYIGAGFKSTYDFGGMKNEFLVSIDRNSKTNRTSTLSSSNSKLNDGKLYIGNLYQYNDWEKPDFLPVGTRLGSKSATKGFSIVDTMKFLDDKLIVNAGLHHHSYLSRSYAANGKVSNEKKFDGNCPTFGIVYLLKPNISIYASHTETFLDGKVVDSKYENGGDILDPGITKSNELGIKMKKGQFLHTLALYETKDPQAMANADNYYLYVGETKYKGIEWTTAGTIGKKLDFIASLGFNRYIWVRNSNPKLDGLTANGIPKWNGNLALAYHVNDDLSILGRASYIGKSHIGYGIYTVPQYYRFDLGMKYDTVMGHTPVTLSAMCYNITNKSGWYSADQGNQLKVTDPRTFMLSAEFRM